MRCSDNNKHIFKKLLACAEPAESNRSHHNHIKQNKLFKKEARSKRCNNNNNTNNNNNNLKKPEPAMHILKKKHLRLNP